ncbi:hypothetical protein KR059_000897 [Drosophila kikkawai]|nr:hypothetical protein KR059_000897 [Drosophila kikkawai]
MPPDCPNPAYIHPPLTEVLAKPKLQIALVSETLAGSALCCWPGRYQLPLARPINKPKFIMDMGAAHTFSLEPVVVVVLLSHISWDYNSYGSLIIFGTKLPDRR